MYNSYEPYTCSYCSYPCPYRYNLTRCAPQFDEGDLSYNDEAYYDSRLDAPQSAGSAPIVLRDYGPQPYVVDIDSATKQNNNYRTALWTGKHLQLTLMSIPVGGDIGVEVHPIIDQFIRVEQGQGTAQMGPSRDNLNFQRNVQDGFAIFIPAGTWHNVVNTGNVPLKLYSIYAPPQHPRGTVHATKEIAHAGSTNPND
jgi:mannose-6-phosphate isomerase-like protein (cupin superfamily)